MVEVAEHIAGANVANGNNVGIFSIEMTGRQIVKRMICSMIDLNLQRLRDGFKAKDTLSKVNAAAAELVKSHVWINDRNLSITDFRYLARRMVTKMKCRLIIIDYIQRMHSTSRRAQGNREQEMNEIAQGISATAKELNIPIIVLAQLNRKNEDRADKVPALSDLRESGSMEQEARFVGLLHRPVYYVPGEDRTEKQKQDGVPIPQGRLKKLRIAARIAGLTSPDPDDNGEIDQKWVDPNNPEGTDWVTRFEEFAQLIVAKQNEGPVGTVNLRFVKQYARFENITKRLYSNNPSQRQQ
jgi:replicative DNA helicase